MKILHTSDWHLGRSLYGKKRYPEFSAFLDWLAQTIEDTNTDILLVAGDVFDTSTPSNQAQALYYGFLCRIATSHCSHVVVIAGNHDSPSFLNAPKSVLQALQVHVVGAMTESLVDELMVLQTQSETTPSNTAIVCAVPYLRDKDIRVVEPGETIDDKNRKLVAGLQHHYAEVVALAEAKRKGLCAVADSTENAIPIIAMGHLFTAGGQTVDGDGVRELYVGSLTHIGAEVFPAAIDYLALGHLHVPQVVGDIEHFRYCGSPIPMGFGEAQQTKQVVLVEFNGSTGSNGCAPDIQTIPVPCFQPLVRITGSLDTILARLAILATEQSRAWLEIEVTGTAVVGNLRDQLEDAVLGTALEILRIKHQRGRDQVIDSFAEDETLDDLEPAEVFSRCLDAFAVPDAERAELTASYQQVIQDLHEQDPNAE